MRKQLLVLGALMLTSVGAFAQATVEWVKPTVEVKGTTMTTGEKVFLYNKAAGGFFRGLGEGESPFWGTRAGVSLAGADTVIIQKPFEENVTEGTTSSANSDVYPYWMTESDWDGSSYLLQVYSSHRHNRWDELWYRLNNFSEIWTDRQNDVTNNENFFFNITPNANSSYTIATSDKSPYLQYQELWELLVVPTADGSADSIVPAIEYGKSYRLGVDLDDINSVCHFEGLTVDKDGVETPANLDYEWTVVSLAEYESLNMEQVNADMKCYNAAASLKDYIEARCAEYPDATFDMSGAWAIYNNLESTVAELDSAKTLVDAVIRNHQNSIATPDNPQDFSDMIVNATFNSDASGWEGDGMGHGSEAAEHYSKNYWTYQDIKGLPAGVYAVSLTGFYRAGSRENDWATKNDPSVRYAKIYAKSGNDSLTAPLPSLAANAIVDDGSLAGELVGDNMLVPQWMDQFKAFKDAGNIKSTTVYASVAEGDSLRIGIAKNTRIDADWTIVDDFKLLYIGNSFDSYDAWRTEVLANSPEVDTIIPDEETLCSQSYLTAYEEAVAAAKAETDPANMGAKIAAIQPALDALYANIAAYKAYLAKAYEVQDELASNTGLNAAQEDVAYLSDYFMDSSEPADGVYPNGGFEYINSGTADLTTEQLEAEIKNLDEWLQKAIKNGAEAGGDMTHMLKNPSFANGFEGWTNSEGKDPIGGVGGVASVCKNVEVFANVVDICQTITGVPAGIYSISAQAFERPSGNGSYTGTEESKVFIFMNDFQTPVMNITMDAMPEADAVHQVNCYMGDGSDNWAFDYNFNGSYVPNSMDGASYAFAAGRYVNKCYGIVGDDGVMKIGLTSNGVSVEWVLWANFKLTFEGKSEEAVSAILQSTIEKANAYAESMGDYMTEPALVELSEAIAAAETADGTGYDACYAALQALNSALADARENVDACNQAYDAIDKLYIALAEYESTATEEAMAKAGELTVKADAAYTLTTEELYALVEEIDIVIAELRMPKVDQEVSDDNPFDMTGAIYNADFESGADGWTWEKNGGNGPTLSGGITGASFEFWTGDADDLDFDIHQTIHALPAGKYAVSADLGNSYNNVAVEDRKNDEGRGSLYAVVTLNGESTYYSTVVEPIEEAATNATRYEVVFDLPEGAEVKLGVMSVGTMDARWFVGDNFALTYYGTGSAKENTGDNGSVDIDEVETADEVVPVAIYSISGARLTAPQKGINIIRMSDGTVKKVLIF